MSAGAKTLTVDEFLSVRAEVAHKLGQDSQTQKPTRERQAEKLMQLGYIDTEAVLEKLRPKPIVDLDELQLMEGE